MLVPEAILSKISGSIDSWEDICQKHGFSSNLLQMEELGQIFRYYLLFTFFPEKVSGIGKETIFYNRYYWLLTLNKRLKKIHGEDAGMDQQEFKLLENAEEEYGNIDWKVVEEIEQQTQ